MMWASRRLPPWAVDALLGAGVTLVVSLVISANQGGRHGPDAVAYLWAVGLGALMFARRRYPVVVLAVTGLGLFAYYAAGYPAVGLGVPVAAALFSAAEFGRLVHAVVTGVVVVVVSVFFRLVEGQDFSFVVNYELAGHILLMAAAITLGDSVRSRRSVQEGARRIAELTAQRYRQEADARVHADRLAIARDLHDSIGHTTSVISLHADVAREALGRDEAQTRAALDLIKSTATRTMAELRRTVALLRSPDENSRSVLSLSNVGMLRETASAAGIDLELDLRIGVGLPATVDASAFRIVQEAVTNIVRHSRGGGARVTAYDDGTALHLRVADDGPGGAGDGRGEDGDIGRGHGITGMRERAEALGGTLTAGYEESGFVVRAVLPLEQPS
ncbi:sensor histidine kinase [Polymorphospora rubra]|uniref:histidine kinase n=1 Tax=Polymorphospora rubra TaxID=338584 RepID=A0A810N3H9_9ACTN|nr:histidine kinase [Polymorphospora rubra]BCJ66258.1 two-component sensor histidine kinase [Polymorphospora rubra]